ncbi:MAG: hypothetical protein L0Y71_25535 [Gemmataceae bacterium]|nr:hypothetical protein [Gemmataceae bacterium]
MCCELANAPQAIGHARQPAGVVVFARHRLAERIDLLDQLPAGVVDEVGRVADRIGKGGSKSRMSPLFFQAFGVDQGKSMPFEPERAKKDVKGEGETKGKGKKGKVKEAQSQPKEVE